MRNIEEVLGNAPLPKGFVAKGYRDAIKVDIDGNISIIAGKVKIKNQYARPSCVGQATASQKGAKEGKEISARDVYRQAKRRDGSADPTSWGTTLWAGQDALVAGCSDEALTPELPADKGTAEYVALDGITPEVEASRKANRAKSAYIVARDLIRATLHQTELPVVTGCMWHIGDNAIGHDGVAVMGMPQGASAGGHAFAAVAFGKWLGVDVIVMQNSWGAAWGRSGFFFVPLADAFHRLYSGYVSVDIDEDLAELLAQYRNKDVQVPRADGSGHDLYRCELGGLRHYPNEIVWWAHGKLFDIDVHDMPRNHFDAIPKIAPMSIDDAPFKTRELVRQVRQHYGQS